MDNPTNFVACTQFDAVQIPTIQCFSQGDDVVVAALGNEVQVAIVGIGRKIRKVATLVMCPRELTILIVGREDASPSIWVVQGGSIENGCSRPCAWIRRVRSIRNDIVQFLVIGAKSAKTKVLKMGLLFELSEGIRLDF